MVRPTSVIEESGLNNVSGGFTRGTKEGTEDTRKIIPVTKTILHSVQYSTTMNLGRFE